MGGRFGGVVTAMVTPFREDFSLDLDRARELARWLLDHGSEALVVAGSTGEAATSPTRRRWPSGGRRWKPPRVADR